MLFPEPGITMRVMFSMDTAPALCLQPTGHEPRRSSKAPYPSSVSSPVGRLLHIQGLSIRAELDSLDEDGDFNLVSHSSAARLLPPDSVQYGMTSPSKEMTSPLLDGERLSMIPRSLLTDSSTLRGASGPPMSVRTQPGWRPTTVIPKGR